MSRVHFSVEDFVRGEAGDQVVGLTVEGDVVAGAAFVRDAPVHDEVGLFDLGHGDGGVVAETADAFEVEGVAAEGGIAV